MSSYLSPAAHAGANRTLRQRWMAALARAPLDQLEAAWSAFEPPPAYELLRVPEIGMVMVRGRSGGTGPKFNLGEMTVTRCVVRLGSGTLGYGYVAGRDRRHAERAAVFDAMLQEDATHARLMREVVEPAEAGIASAARDVRQKAAATKVQFFTMVRGE